jgi:Transglycosylase SLT domain
MRNRAAPRDLHLAAVQTVSPHAMSRLLRMIFLSAAVLIQPALADVPVKDKTNLIPRTADEIQSLDSKAKKADDIEEKRSFNCNISKSEKNRRLYNRSPAKAVAEESRNVELIKHYADKYNVPAGLALSVAYAESGIDTCAGSPTGVKGVMQLTKSTGKGLGFNRDINDQNIEGGVKYLGLGVKKCGQTNYACLASWYNGSTMAEQRGWASKVARNHGWFNAYAGGGNIPDIVAPTFDTAVDYGSDTTNSVLNNGGLAVNRASTGMNASAQRIQEIMRILQALSDGNGSSIRIQDAWDENTKARSINAELTNQMILLQTLLNELLIARLNLRNAETSQTVKVTDTDETVSPYSCDPVILTNMRIPERLWPDCAKMGARTSSNELTTGFNASRIFAPLNDSAASAVEAIQNQSN